MNIEKARPRLRQTWEIKVPGRREKPEFR